jgi:cob(I)alamin adenosyltransferase
VDNLLVYLNRLSDYFFVLARYCNHIAGVEEITWHG